MEWQILYSCLTCSHPILRDSGGMGEKWKRSKNLSTIGAPVQFLLTCRCNFDKMHRRLSSQFYYWCDFEGVGCTHSYCNSKDNVSHEIDGSSIRTAIPNITIETVDAAAYERCSSACRWRNQSYPISSHPWWLCYDIYPRHHNRNSRFKQMLIWDMKLPKYNFVSQFN